MPALPALLLALLLHAHLCRPAPLNGNTCLGGEGSFWGWEATLTQPWLLPRASRCSPPSIAAARAASPWQGLCRCSGSSALSPSLPTSGKRPEKPLRPDRRLPRDYCRGLVPASDNGFRNRGDRWGGRRRGYQPEAGERQGKSPAGRRGVLRDHCKGGDPPLPFREPPGQTGVALPSRRGSGPPSPGQSVKPPPREKTRSGLV